MYRKDCLMCCPSAKVVKSDTTGFLPIGGLHEGKLCDTLQAMAPTNVDRVHQTSLLPIESNLDRLGLLSSTHDHRTQQLRGQIPLRLDLMNKPKFLKAGRHAEIREIVIPRFMTAEALSWFSRA